MRWELVDSKVGGVCLLRCMSLHRFFFGVLFSWMLNSNASMALQILFAVMVSVSQVVILSSLLYWAAEFLRKIR